MFQDGWKKTISSTSSGNRPAHRILILSNTDSLVLRSPPGYQPEPSASAASVARTVSAPRSGTPRGCLRSRSFLLRTQLMLSCSSKRSDTDSVHRRPSRVSNWPTCKSKAPHLGPTGITGLLPFPVSNFKHCLTLFSKFFSSFPHCTCSLSVSRRYLALDEIYHPLSAAIPNNATR